METLEKERNTIQLPMRKEDFLQWNPEDGFLYEYNNGFAEQKNYMEPHQLFIVKNISRKFSRTQAYQAEGEIISEVKFKTGQEQIRIADMAFLTQPQLVMAANYENIVPSFVIEVISESDNASKLEKKLREYFNAGVQTVWYIYTNEKVVYVYTSFKKVTICTDADTINASPAIPDLQLSVDELFKI
jgi:Uma2 family endonuclease